MLNPDDILYQLNIKVNYSLPYIDPKDDAFYQIQGAAINAAKNLEGHWVIHKDGKLAKPKNVPEDIKSIEARLDIDSNLSGLVILGKLLTGELIYESKLTLDKEYAALDYQFGMDIKPISELLKIFNDKFTDKPKKISYETSPTPHIHYTSGINDIEHIIAKDGNYFLFSINRDYELEKIHEKHGKELNRLKRSIERSKGRIIPR